MLEPYQRAALIPNDPGTSWHHFLRGRYVGSFPQAGSEASLGIVVQAIEQQSPDQAELRGFIEQGSGSSLPVVSAFVGALNVDTREISIHLQADKIYHGQISENGRVIVLRQSRDAKPIHLVHEGTLAQLV